MPRLRPLLDRKGGTLSGGEQQILALARALMPAPWLLLLDEPSEGIQPSIVQEIGEMLTNLRRRDKLALVIVEQNLDLVLDVADRIVVMERGRIARELDAHGHAGRRPDRIAGDGVAAHVAPRALLSRAAAARRRRHVLSPITLPTSAHRPRRRHRLQPSNEVTT